MNTVSRRLERIDVDKFTRRILGTTDPSEYEELITDLTPSEVADYLVDYLKISDEMANKLEVSRLLVNRARWFLNHWRTTIQSTQAQQVEEEAVRQAARQAARDTEAQQVREIVFQQQLIATRANTISQNETQCVVHEQPLISGLAISNVSGLTADPSVPHGQLWIPDQYIEDVVNLTSTFDMLVAARIVNPANGVEISLSVGQQHTTDDSYRINPRTRRLIEHYRDGQAIPTAVDINLIIPPLIDSLTVSVLSDDDNVRALITPEAIAEVLLHESNGLVSVGVKLPIYDTYIQVINCTCMGGQSTLTGYVMGTNVQEYSANIEIV